MRRCYIHVEALAGEINSDFNLVPLRVFRARILVLIYPSGSRQPRCGFSYISLCFAFDWFPAHYRGREWSTPSALGNYRDAFPTRVRCRLIRNRRLRDGFLAISHRKQTAFYELLVSWRQVGDRSSSLDFNRNPSAHQLGQILTKF